MKSSFQKYICVDPSFFTSVKRFDTLSPVIHELKKDDSKIVIPTFLKPLFDLEERQNDLDGVNPDVASILKEWNSSFNKNNNDTYQTLRWKIKDFASTFFSSLIFADELVEGFLKNRKPPIALSDIVAKLGKKGKTIFEFVVIGTHNGIIASYGRKLISFIRKIQMSTSEGFSSFKHRMIASGRAPELLKIVAFVFTATAFNDFITGFEIINMPFIAETDIIESGLGIIANGNG